MADGDAAAPFGPMRAGSRDNGAGIEAMTDLVDQILEAIGHDPFAVCAELDFQSILSAVKPRRVRSWNQRDVTRALRAAKAAGLAVREIAPDGRLILAPADADQQSPNARKTESVSNPWDSLFYDKVKA
jgi:hypothetical protein